MIAHSLVVPTCTATAPATAGALLTGLLEARGFWGAAYERQHITWKGLKAVRLAVESFLPHLAGRRVLLLENNQAVCSVLAGLTSRSPEMMAELRKLWYLLDSNGVHIRARYIRSAANVWADRLSRHLDGVDWQLDPVLFAKLEAMWVDSLHMSDAEWHRENNYCNLPWPLLPDLVQKLRQSGAAATVVAPRWKGRVWHHALTEMAVANLHPYLSAINGFYRDHGAEPVAQGDLISKVRKGLAASQVELDPPRVRTDVPARLITRTLRLAETLRAATAAYAIGVVLQKIKHFGGWAQLSSVLLDYINPTALPCAASWQLFG
eukprot:jgi/Tetstr1/434418/TSEL_023518.t1